MTGSTQFESHYPEEMESSNYVGDGALSHKSLDIDEVSPRTLQNAVVKKADAPKKQKLRFNPHAAPYFVPSANIVP